MRRRLIFLVISLFPSKSFVLFIKIVVFVSVKDALAVASDVNVVKDACLRHFGQGAKVEDGLTEAQFMSACADLADEKGFGNFGELAEDKGLAAAVYSRSVRGAFSGKSPYPNNFAIWFKFLYRILY